MHYTSFSTLRKLVMSEILPNAWILSFQTYFTDGKIEKNQTVVISNS